MSLRSMPVGRSVWSSKKEACEVVSAMGEISHMWPYKNAIAGLVVAVGSLLSAGRHSPSCWTLSCMSREAFRSGQAFISISGLGRIEPSEKGEIITVIHTVPLGHTDIIARRQFIGRNSALCQMRAKVA